MISIIRTLMTHTIVPVGLPAECITEGHDFDDFVLVGEIDWQIADVAMNCNRCEIPYDLVVSE